MAATDNILAKLGNTGGGSDLQRAVEAPPTNSLAGGGMAANPAMKALMEKLKRQTAFQGFEGILSLLELLNGGGGILPGNIGNIGNGSNNSGCLHGDTLVRMADGSEKPAREIVVEDQLMGLDPEIGLRSQSVFTVQSSRQPCVRVRTASGVDIIASTSHPFFTSDKTGLKIMTAPMMQLGFLCLVDEAGEEQHIVSIEDAGSHIVYWWNCTMNHNYYAGGVLHHNEGGGLGNTGASGTNTFGGFGKGVGSTSGFTLGTGTGTGAGSE